MIGTEAIARAPADGYTLLLASPAHTISFSLYVRLSFSPFKSVAPVIIVGMVPNVILVNPSVPAKTLPELS